MIARYYYTIPFLHCHELLFIIPSPIISYRILSPSALNYSLLSSPYPGSASMGRKNRLIVAVETNPLEHVDFRDCDGTLKPLKVFAGCAEHVGKLFVLCDLCWTFIPLGTRHSPKTMETHRDKAKCKEQKKKKEREMIKQQEQAALKLFNEPGTSTSRLESECQ